jgi:hypothetical protein
MAEKALKEEYKTPRIEVRGVFLCNNIAETSVKVSPFTQNDWVGDNPVGSGSSNTEGDLWIGIH